MSEQLKEIAGRVKELREVENVAVEVLAEEINVPAEKIRAYESGSVDIPISYLTKLAQRFNVEITEMITGEEPRLRMYSLCRKGKGISVERFKEYEYQSLVYKFAHKKCEPYYVTVQASKEDKPLYMNSHEGHEFDYVLSGTLKMVIEDKELILEEGDCVYLDSKFRHALKAVGDKDVNFLAIVLP